MIFMLILMYACVIESSMFILHLTILVMFVLMREGDSWGVLYDDYMFTNACNI